MTRPASTTARGYGTEHQKLRRRLAPIVNAGRTFCARGDDCLLADRPEGTRILPGEPWDLDHNDHDRTQYLGPSHRACNRSTAGRRVISYEW